MEKLNMKKFPLRLLGALLAALLVLAVFPINALAEGSVKLTLTTDKDTAIAGDEVTVTVSIGDTNPGIASMCFDLEYDKTVFTLKEDSAEILGEFKTNSGSLKLMEERQKVYNLEAISPQDRMVTFNWIYSGALNSGLSGAQDCTLSNVAFAKLVFIVNEGVTENKEVDFVLKPSEENIFSIVGGMPDVPVTGYTDNAAKTIVKSVTVKKSYTVTYDANEGTGVPGPQKKADGVALTLSETVPTRDGYKFLGWARNENATAKEYDSGDTSFNINDNTTLFAVWQERAKNVEFTVSDGSGVAKGKVSVDISLSYNDGKFETDKIELPLSFGNLQYVSVSDNTWTYENGKLSWKGDLKEIAEGKLLTVTFNIPETATAGKKYTVSINSPVVSDSDYNYSVSTQDGTITVVDYILGDVNGDGVVTPKDGLILSRYLAGWSEYKTINEVAADVNSDGVLSPKDGLILARHLAGWKGYETLPKIQ